MWPRFLRSKGNAFAVLIALLLAFASPSHAQSTWPSDKPVTIVVAYKAGGPSDVIGRLVGKQLSAMWGVPVLVDNKAGAGGHIAAQYVARSKPDGHTLLLIDAGSITSATHLIPDLKYDPLTELASVGVLGFTPHVYVVRKMLPVSNFAELLSYAKTRPGGLSFATQSGLPQHLSAIKLATQEQLDWTYVFYKGSAAFLTDMIGEHVDVALTAYSGAAAYAKGGKLKIIAVASDQRFPLAPEVPAVTETISAGISAGSWQILMAPKGIPPDVLAKIHASVKAVVNAPDFKTTLSEMGLAVADRTPKELDATLAQESKMYADIIKASNLK